MSRITKKSEINVEFIAGLDDLELQLLEYDSNFNFNPSERMSALLLNPVYLDVWINAKPDTLH